MASPDSLAIALRKGMVMTLRLDELILGDLVLGFDVKTQSPAFSKLILWSEADFRTNTKYLLVELEDESQLKVKGDQLIIVKGTPIIIKTTPDIVTTTPDIAETTPDITDITPDIAETTPDIAETTPDIDTTTPDIAETTPDNAETTPDIIITTSDIVMTKTVKPGDSLYKRNVGYVEVRSVTKVTEKGFCRPITASGTILVDNIAISCYNNLSELYVKDKHVISAQMQGRVGYGPLVLFRKFFKGNVSTLTELEKPHPYGAVVNTVFSQKK